jgi:formylglycine-generating enzyme required for sulfatase activity
MMNLLSQISPSIKLKRTYEKIFSTALILTITLIVLPITNIFAVNEGIDQNSEDLMTADIIRLLSAAQQFMEAGYLTEPDGDNALEMVREILQQDPDHLGAARILSNILKRHTQSLQEALNNKDYEGARKYLKEIRKINPDAIAVSDAEKHLEQILQQDKRPENIKSEQNELAGEMILIPGGTYLMGTLAGRNDEKPQHLVTVDSFEMAKHEVTRGQFKKFIDATGYMTDAEKNTFFKGCFADGGGVDFGWKEGVNWYEPGFTQTDQHPVTCVSWNDAKAYIEWLNKETGSNYRLATEAKWEYAARARSTTDYHFGNTQNELCLYANLYDEVGQKENRYGWRHVECNDGVAKTAPVGTYKVNPFGLYDMHGNVWEWVEDCWKKGYDDAPSNGDEYISDSCDNRVARGGSWYNIPTGVRSANRYWYSPTYRAFNLGFRLFRKI